MNHAAACDAAPASVGSTLDAALAEADPAAATLPAPACTAARLAVTLAARCARPHDQGRAAAWLCVHLLRLGRHADVLREAPAARALVATPALLAVRRELLRTVAMAASELGDFDAALEAAQELVRISTGGAATDGAGPAGAGAGVVATDPGPGLVSSFTLAVCFERMGDSWQAVRLVSQALASRGLARPDLPLLVATNGLCAISMGMVHRLLDTGADAEVQQVLAEARAAGEQAHALLAQVPDRVYEVAVLGNLGEVMLYQGELAAAEPLLRRAHGLALQRGLGAHAWRVQASLGAWLLASAGPAAALAAMRPLVAEMGPAAPQQTAIRAHHVAYRACRALGRHDEALAHFEVVERTERQRAVSQLRAQSQLFVTRTEAQHDLWQAEWQTEQARQEAHVQRARAAEFAASAEQDPLTGLGNRRHLDRRCAELLPVARHEGSALSVAQIDIDRFKAINDSHGHAAGDQVLVALTQVLRENTRSADVLARHGGEEFVVVLPGLALPAAAEVCERLRVKVAAHGWPLALPVTVSVGLAAAPPYDAATLLQRADSALYDAKRGGRNRLCICADAA